MTERTLRELSAEAQRLVDRESYSDAIKIARQILHYYPKYIGSYVILGQSSLERGDLAEAADLFQRALSADPENVTAWVGLASTYEHEDTRDTMVWHLERALEIDPGNSGLREVLRNAYGERTGGSVQIKLNSAALGHIYLNGGHFQQAADELRAALAQDDNRPHVKVWLALALWNLGQTDEAAGICQELLQQSPYCLQANLILGEILGHGERAPEARRYLDLAQELDPENRKAEELFGYLSPLEPSKPALPAPAGFELEPAAVEPEAGPWGRPSQPVAAPYEGAAGVSMSDEAILAGPLASRAEPAIPAPIGTETSEYDAAELEPLGVDARVSGLAPEPAAEPPLVTPATEAELLAGVSGAEPMAEWLQAMPAKTPEETAPAEGLTATEPAEVPETELPAAEAQLAAPTIEEADYQPAAESERTAAEYALAQPQAGETEEEVPDWLRAMAQETLGEPPAAETAQVAETEETPAEPEPAEEVPEWLRSLAGEPEPPAEEPAPAESEAEQQATGPLPDWLTELMAHEQPTEGPTTRAASGLSEPVEPELPELTTPLPADEQATTGPLPDWLTDLMGQDRSLREPAGEAGPEAAPEELSPANGTEEPVPTWLEGLRQVAIDKPPVFGEMTAPAEPVPAPETAAPVEEAEVARAEAVPAPEAVGPMDQAEVAPEQVAPAAEANPEAAPALEEAPAEDLSRPLAALDAAAGFAAGAGAALAGAVARGLGREAEPIETEPAAAMSGIEPAESPAAAVEPEAGVLQTGAVAAEALLPETPALEEVAPPAEPAAERVPAEAEVAAEMPSVDEGIPQPQGMSTSMLEELLASDFGTGFPHPAAPAAEEAPRVEPLLEAEVPVAPAAGIETEPVAEELAAPAAALDATSNALSEAEETVAPTPAAEAEAEPAAEAAPAAAAVLAQAPEGPADPLARARSIRSASGFEPAAEEYEALIQSDQELDAVTSDLESVVAGPAPSTRAWTLLGDAYMKLGRLPDALAAYRRALGRR